MSDDEDRTTRGASNARGWNKRSQLRMQSVLQELDYKPMFDEHRPLALVTLTMPGVSDDGDYHYWQQLAPTPQSFKKMINRWQGVYARSWGSAPVGAWKLEFQDRGAPHLHLLMVPPEGRRRILKPAAGGEKAHYVVVPFSEWAAIAWAKIVGATGRALQQHVYNGVDVNFRSVWPYSDPRRIGAYFAKHGSFSAKDYQNEFPQLWRQAIRDGKGGVNMWGYWGLAKVVESAPLSRRAGSGRPAAFAPEDGPVRYRQLPEKGDIMSDQ